MDSTEDDGTSEPTGTDAAEQTTSRNRFVEWLLIDGNRLSLTVAGSVAVFVLLLVSYHLGVIAFTNDDSITRMASGMIAGTFSLVTLVVSVNQLILSQEFSPAGEFRDRLEGVLEFREDVEAVTGTPAAPPEPSRLLELLAVAIRHRADVLADSVAEHENEEVRSQIVRFANRVADSTERIDETLDRTGVTTFDALTTATEYDNAWQLYAAKHLRNDTPTLSEETVEMFDELIETLRLFNTAQEHFKTIYLQQELTRFSQLTIYCGVPAVLAAVFMILLYGNVGVATVGTSYLPYVTLLLATAVFVPLILLASYILRTATLTRRTAAIGPVLPQKDPSEGPYQVSYDDVE